MRKLEDPLNFKSKVIIHNGKYHITYHSFTEITQGGPEIGILSINGNDIQNKKFGGPILFDTENIYAPCFVKNFFSVGFRLCEINLETLEAKEVSSKIYPIIDLIDVTEKGISFYKSLYSNDIITLKISRFQFSDT